MFEFAHNWEISLEVFLVCRSELILNKIMREISKRAVKMSHIRTRCCNVSTPRIFPVFRVSTPPRPRPIVIEPFLRENRKNREREKSRNVENRIRGQMSRRYPPNLASEL